MNVYMQIPLDPQPTFDGFAWRHPAHTEAWDFHPDAESMALQILESDKAKSPLGYAFADGSGDAVQIGPMSLEVVHVEIERMGSAGVFCWRYELRPSRPQSAT